MKVAVAIIVDAQQRILITQRPLHLPHGGCWEFPGGKLEANELAEEALVREIREEVGIEANEYQFLGEVKYQYPEKYVELFIFLVTQFSGVASRLEEQMDMKWIKREALNSEYFLEANRQVIDLIPVLV